MVVDVEDDIPRHNGAPCKGILMKRHPGWFAILAHAEDDEAEDDKPLRETSQPMLRGTSQPTARATSRFRMSTAFSTPCWSVSRSSLLSPDKVSHVFTFAADSMEARRGGRRPGGEEQQRRTF